MIQFSLNNNSKQQSADTIETNVRCKDWSEYESGCDYAITWDGDTNISSNVKEAGKIIPSKGEQQGQGGSRGQGNSGNQGMGGRCGSGSVGRGSDVMGKER